MIFSLLMKNQLVTKIELKKDYKIYLSLLTKVMAKKTNKQKTTTKKTLENTNYSLFFTYLPVIQFLIK